MAKKEYSFYPGCSSERKASAANYMVSVESMCKTLDVKLNEIPDWNCCGASIGYAEGGELPRHIMNARNIAISEKEHPGQDIVATCAACWLGTKETSERVTHSGQLLADINGILADAGLKRIDHAFADHHVTIAVVFGADRMPTPAETAVMNEQEDDFRRRLGTLAIYAGRVTERGRRTMHFAAEDPDAMRPAIDGWALDLPDHLSEGLPQLRLKIDFERDMDWSFQRDLGVR